MQGNVTIIKIMPPLPGYVDTVKAIMQEHGGNVEVYPDFCIVSFPPGTIKGRMSFFIMCSARYEITFPDRYKVWEVVGRDRLHTLEFLTPDNFLGRVEKYKEVVERNN